MLQEGIQRIFLLIDVDVGIHPENRCRGGLGIAIDDADAIALQREILCQMDDDGGFSHAALEVLHRKNKRWIFRFAVRQRAEHLAHPIDLGQGIAVAAARRLVLFGLRQAAIGLGIADRLFRSPDHFGSGSDIVDQFKALLRSGCEHAFPQAFNDGCCAAA